MKKTLLVLSAFLCCSFNLLCAQNLLKGIVKTEKGYPVKSATIAIEGTQFGTITNNKGLFELNYNPADGLILRAHSLNYKDARIQIDKIKDKSSIEIILPDKSFNLSEVVITGTGTHTYLKETPIHTQIFTQKEIQNTGSTSLEEILANMNSSVNFSSHLGLVANGLGGRNILVLIDGNKINGDTGGQTDIDRIDMSKVKRIEVIKGSASALYGSEAMGGVINIITQNPTDKVNISTTNKISRKGQFYNSTVAELKLGKVTSQTTYQRRQTDGWQLSPYEWEKKWDEEGNPIIKPTMKQSVTGYYTDNYKQKFTYTPTRNLTLKAFGSYYDRKTKRVKAEPSYKYDMYYDGYNVGAGATYRLKDKLGHISLNSYFDNYETENHYFKKAKDINPGDKIPSKRQRYTNTQLKGVFNLGNHQLNTGFDYTTDYLKNEKQIGESKSAYTAAIYAQDEMKFFDALSVVAGFRALHHETFKNRFVPSLSAMYAFEHLNLRASYSAGFRAPDLLELYYDGTSGTTHSHSNKDLKPEKSNSVSMNAEYFNDFFTISTTAYINFISDVIQRTNVTADFPEVDGKHWQYQNVDKARTRGVNVSMQFLLTRGLTLGANYSYLDAQNLHPENHTQKYLDATSRHTGAISLNYNNSWKFYDFNANINGHLQSRTYYQNKYDIRYNTDARAFNLWNLTTTHRFNAIKHFTPELSVGIDNIFNFKDEQPFLMRYATTSPGRSFFASVTLKFNK